MSEHTIQLRSYSPDLLIEFDLLPGTHARLGASPAAEVTIPFSELAPFICTVGRFSNGRLFLADVDGAISQRLDLPATLSLPPYRFVVVHPDESA